MSTASSQDLTDAFENLQSSLIVLFNFYKFYIKLFMYLFLSWLFYKIGHLSIRDEILKQKAKIINLIKKKNSLKIDIPQKINKLRLANKIIIFLTLLSLFGIIISHFFKYIKIVKYQILIIGSILLIIIVLLIILNVYKFFLSVKIKKVDYLDKQINKNLIIFQKSLGDKVIMILKNHLCRKYENNISTINQCKKNDCKQLRALYKIRNQSMSILIEQTINFQWCSICKKRQSFNEFLPFEFRQYQKHSENEDDEVKQRMNYLIQGLQKMSQWIGHTNPCNCSKIYWNMSTQQIIAYKRDEKSTEIKIKELENKSKNF